MELDQKTLELFKEASDIVGYPIIGCNYDVVFFDVIRKYRELKDENRRMKGLIALGDKLQKANATVELKWINAKSEAKL